jgi:hypothetical protein
MSKACDRSDTRLIHERKWQRRANTTTSEYRFPAIWGRFRQDVMEYRRRELDGVA